MSKVPRETLIGLMAVQGCGLFLSGVYVLTSTGWTLLASGVVALAWAAIMARSGGEQP